jgi:4-diphosphocytidyl-2-C-methyl-D-erythritol kinase
MTFHAQSAAKVNLSLDILSRRPDGYHELASVVHTIGLWDEIEGVIQPKASGVTFECDVAELEGDDNLCVRAVQRFQAATRQEFGIAMRLKKRIPTGAGLGGGSGNAATVLRALNRAFNDALDEASLLELGASLGADVPLFLRGGAVLMEGIGERLSPLAALSGWLLVVKPKVSLSTPAVYRAWDEAELISHRTSEKLLRVWNTGNGAVSLETVASALGNDLERAAAILTPAPARCVEYLRQCGSLGALMSGSGSACFGLFADEAGARTAQAQLTELVAKDVLRLEATTFVVPLSPHGTLFA